MLFTCKIILVGDTKVGKTALTNCIRKKDFDANYNPTIGADLAVYTQEPIKLQIWDTSGNKQYQYIIQTYIQDASIMVYMLDSTQGLEQNKSILQELRQIITEKSHVSDFSELIVFTKSDDINSKLSENYTNGFNTFNIPCITFSAKTREGVTEILNNWINSSLKEMKRKQEEEREKGEKLVDEIKKYSDLLDKVGSKIAQNKSIALCRIINIYHRTTQDDHSLSRNEISEIKKVINQEKETLLQHRHWPIFNCFFYFFKNRLLENRITSYKLINNFECYLDNLRIKL